MPEVVDMLDDDSNDGGVTIDLLSLDSDDEASKGGLYFLENGNRGYLWILR